MKKYIVFVISLLLFMTPVYASTTTYDRLDYENHGVNKKWNITEKNYGNVLKTKLVDASELIYDFSDILTDEEEKELFDIFTEFKQKTGMDIVFVSDNVPYSDDYEMEEYTSDFYDYNDFGINSKLYDGILFFRNTYEQDPYYCMNIFGETQLYIVPTLRESILDDVYNEIHSGLYVQGLKHWVSLSEDYIVNREPSKAYRLDDMGVMHKNVSIPLVIVITLIIVIIIVGVNISKNKMIRKVVKANEYLAKDKYKVTKKRDMFIHSTVTSYTVSSSSGGGGGGHVGSSGGGHSFGGRHG